MKKFIQRIVTTALASVVTLATSTVMLGGSVHAIPYTPDATGLNHPGFNIFTGVPGYGDESDFVRGRVTGSSTDFVDPINDNCADGTQYSVRVYVHNGANQTLNNNGTGTGVAHNTKVTVTVPSTTATKINGSISASNATTVNDTMTINCNGKVMQLSYVAGSAIEQRVADGSTAPLSDSIVTTGALIDDHGVAGDMWGCFEQRVLVFLKVQVKEIPVIPSAAICKTIDVTVDNKSRKVTVNKVTTSLTNATVLGYKIEWGDGSTSNKSSDEHVYATDGVRTLKVSVHVKFADGTDKWITDNCAQVVNFTSTPQTPTTLPSTGPGDVIGIFAAVTVAGALAHRYVWSRRFNA